MRSDSRLKSTDLVVLPCIAAMLLLVILPAIAATSGRSRAAVCRNNLKAIGVGLELWRQNAGRYPEADMPGFHDTGINLCPWTEMLALNFPFDDREYLETYFASNPDGRSADDFIKTIDDDSVLMCPADHPHPHRMNEDRAKAWGFWRADVDDGYQRSYAIGQRAAWGSLYPDSERQILTADGMWPWCHNTSGYWVTNPGWNVLSPTWFSNITGYWHRGNSANFLLRDTHVENHEYPPDTNEVFFYWPGENLNVY